MPALEEFLPALFANIKNILPFREVAAYQQGVRYTCGKITKGFKKPGIYWYCYVIQRISVENTNDQPIDLPNQSVTTKDNKTLSLSSGIVYSIHDLRLYELRATNLERIYSLLTRGLIRSAARNREYEELNGDHDVYVCKRERLKRLHSEARKFGRFLCRGYEKGDISLQYCDENLEIDDESESEEWETESMRLSIEDWVFHVLKGFSQYYGVRIKYFGFTDEIETVGMRLFGDTEYHDST